MLGQSIIQFLRHSHSSFVPIASSINAQLQSFTHPKSEVFVAKRWQTTITTIKMSRPADPKSATLIQLDSEPFRALFTDELNSLAALFDKYKYEIRIAGGAVRDLLMDVTPNDVDFATTATPEQMLEMFDKEKGLITVNGDCVFKRLNYGKHYDRDAVFVRGDAVASLSICLASDKCVEIRVLHKAGEKHGTVACRINDKENFEVTTLRIDVSCDGRRADVEFTTDWQIDANRRDLTVNSLFLDLNGVVYDYFGGVDDVKSRTVRFVGDAEARIQEDYLRILRYFRFFGRLSNRTDGHDTNTLKAIKDNAHGLKGISGERLWTELKKIAVGRFAGSVMAVMKDECGLFTHLAIPEQSDVHLFARVVDNIKSTACFHTEQSSPSLEPMTVLSSLLADESELALFHARLKLSNHDKLLAAFIIKHRNTEYCRQDADAHKQMAYFKDMLLDLVFTRVPRGSDHLFELLKYSNLPTVYTTLKSWSAPVFPVNGSDLLEHQALVPKGPSVRLALAHLFALWKQSDCEMDKDALLKHLNDESLQTDIQKCLSPKQKRRKMRQMSENEGKLGLN